MDKDTLYVYVVASRPLIYKSQENDGIDSLKKNRDTLFKSIRSYNPSFKAPFLGICSDNIILSDDLDVLKDKEQLFSGRSPSYFGGMDYSMDTKELKVNDIVTMFRKTYALRGIDYTVENVITFDYFFEDLLSLELKKNKDLDIKRYYLGDIFYPLS